MFPASSRSINTPTSSTPSIANSAPQEGTKSSTTEASSASSPVRPVSTMSAGGGDGRQDAFEYAVGGGALEFGLGAELDPAPHGRAGQCLGVVGGHVVAAGQPRRGPRGGGQRRRPARGDPELQGRRLAGGPAQV